MHNFAAHHYERTTENITESLELISFKDTVQVVADHCESSENTQTPETCFYTYFTEQWADRFDVVMCTTQTQSSTLEKTCEHIDTYIQGLSDESSAPCRNITEPDIHDQCILTITQKLGQQKHHASELYSGCEPIHNTKQKLNCQIEAHRVASRQASNISCDSLPNATQQECTTSHTISQAITDTTPNLCKTISPIALSEYCIDQVFAQTIFTYKGTYDCSELQKSRLAICQEWRDIAHAIRKEKRQSCAQTAGSRAQLFCLQLLTNPAIEQRLAKTLDLSHQENIDRPPATTLSHTLAETTEHTAPTWTAQSAGTELQVSAFPTFSPNPGSTPFKRLSMGTLGLEPEDFAFDYTDMFEPFLMGKGVASGDFNNDGWPDLLFATHEGIALYRNLGRNKTSSTPRFQREAITFDHTQNLNAFIASLVDFNNDGWLDIFFTTYQSTNYVALNQQGSFDQAALIRIPASLKPGSESGTTIAAGFIDRQSDGDLDILFGNWSIGTLRGFIPQYSDNYWADFSHNAFALTPEPSLKGETLSVLFSDILNDHHTDLIIANDMREPNILYLGTGDVFVELNKHSGVLPHTSTSTMSLDSADFNNDLKLDVFESEISQGTGQKSGYCDLPDRGLPDSECNDILEGITAIRQYQFAYCNELTDRARKVECLTSVLLNLASTTPDKHLCERMPPSHQDEIILCERLSKIRHSEVAPDYSNHFPQKANNKLLMRQGKNNRFEDKTDTMGVGQSYWSWNAKAADLDNDEWQDIYVGNGFGFGNELTDIHSNVFYHNQQGQRFATAQDAFGLNDHISTHAYTFTDLDLDGDLDIVATGTLAMPRLFLNQQATHHSISFELIDLQGNRHCVGCKVIIHYGEKRHQIREIKLSGGFLSFDDTIAHFGLGNHQTISAVEIVWSDGTLDQLLQTLPANHRYRIVRPAQ